MTSIMTDGNNRCNMCAISILFMPESTEGVDPGQVTALDYENEANRTEKWENGTNIGQIEQNFTLILEFMSMCAFGGMLIEEVGLM